MACGAVDTFDSESLFVSFLSIGEIARGSRFSPKARISARCKSGFKRWSVTMVTGCFLSILKPANLGRTHRRRPTTRTNGPRR